MKRIIKDKLGCITIVDNCAKRTFTIRIYNRSYKLLSKYRTIPINDEEFQYQLFFWTDGDWIKFIMKGMKDNAIRL